MSDIGLVIPIWLVVFIVAAEFWPIVLVLAVAALGVAFYTSGRWRIAAIGVALLLVADLAASGVFAVSQMRQAATDRQYDAGIGSDLAAAQVIDGLTLPAGTTVTWMDPTHTRVLVAALSQPATVLGVVVERLQRTVDDGWVVRLVGPQSIDGWMCRPDFVELAADGHLRTCTLAASREWNGWPIPAQSLLRLDRADHAVGVVFPDGPPVLAPEIGRALPLTGLMTINADGSLDAVYFDADAPLAICGVTLWNTVTWRYDAATIGQGRNRKPVGVSGASPEGDTVDLSLPGCGK